jgi:hypothetical protein
MLHQNLFRLSCTNVNGKFGGNLFEGPPSLGRPDKILEILTPVAPLNGSKKARLANGGSIMKTTRKKRASLARLAATLILVAAVISPMLGGQELALSNAE